jgi:hypothetical protein
MAVNRNDQSEMTFLQWHGRLTEMVAQGPRTANDLVNSCNKDHYSWLDSITTHHTLPLTPNSANTQRKVDFGGFQQYSCDIFPAGKA